MFREIQFDQKISIFFKISHTAFLAIFQRDRHLDKVSVPAQDRH
jgi:hypothetical protein